MARQAASNAKIKNTPPPMRCSQCRGRRRNRVHPAHTPRAEMNIKAMVAPTQTGTGANFMANPATAIWVLSPNSAKDMRVKVETEIDNVSAIGMAKRPIPGVCFSYSRRTDYATVLGMLYCSNQFQLQKTKTKSYKVEKECQKVLRYAVPPMR